MPRETRVVVQYKFEMAAVSVIPVKKRKHLSLEKKVEVIKAEGRGKTSIRSLAQEFDCGRTQIADILKKKKVILDLYSSNAHKNKQVIRPKQSEYAELNQMLYDWYNLAVSKNIYPAGPQLSEKAKEIANTVLGKPDFKASNGWLDKWKKRYNIRQITISGEAGDVAGETVESWKERLPELLQGYEAKDVWNLDETGCFWKALPEKGFGQKKKECKGGKKSKQRLTIAFITNAAGGKEAPIVIWKSKKPRCFSGVIKSQLPVQYYNQTNAWMSGEILHEILAKINRQLVAKSRSIILLLDNAGCHPPDIVGKYGNIKIIWLPPNTTSKLQPLDLGIIQNFKTYYRKLLLKYVLSKIDECETGSDVAKSVNVLLAIRWIAQAWDSVQESTIAKCFKKAGVTCDDGSVTSRIEGDPFADLDDHQNDDQEDQEVQALVNNVMGNREKCSADEYINGDDDLDFCFDLNNDQWENEFFTMLRSSQTHDCDGELNDNNEEESNDDTNDDDDTDTLTAEPKIKTIKNAIQSLEEVQYFLEYHGYRNPSSLSSVIDTLADINSKKLIQTTIDDFLF